MLFDISHAPDLLLVLELFEARFEVRPPLEQHRLADELEPRSELERRVLEQLLELLGRYISRGLDLVLVDVEIDIGLDEEDIINWAVPC